jgi:hypothetical protein
MRGEDNHLNTVLYIVSMLVYRTIRRETRTQLTRNRR